MRMIGAYQVVETLCLGPRPLYKARAVDGRTLALKTASIESLSAEMRERFNREAQVCSSLDHPNLVRVLDWGEADGVLYQAMDLLEGADLAKVFASGHALSWPAKVSLMEQVCDGLHYAHQRGLVHRDIKPANIFLERSGQVRLLDFGMARIDASTLTQDGMTLGTINYMAPEQIRGEQCTPASDIFSLGIVFYQVATGRHPFAGPNRNVSMILNAILFDTPPPLSEVTPDAPEGLDFVIGRALEKDPSLRLPSATDLKQALSLARVALKMRARSDTLARVAALAHPARETSAVRGPSTPPPPPPPATGTAPAAAAASQLPSATGVPKPPGRPSAVFCPSCTHANPAGAASCERCGQPLASKPFTARRSQQPPPLRVSVKLAIAFAVSGILMLVLVVAIVLSRR